MKTNEAQDQRLIIKDEAVPFEFDELFFSRTDERGIIQSGNSVFQRVSIYSWDELIKKPHSVVRHPDMPKAVFWLLWNIIKQGNPIGAYVKNRAKDGRYYWVFAIVTPVDGGFLSVRLKPSSQIFSIVEEEYKTIRHQENITGISAEESAKILVSRLKELGFNDYTSFMAAALSAEMKERDKQIDSSEDNVIKCYDALLNGAKGLLKQADNIFSSYMQHQYVPLNLRVRAAQLGETGATIGVISSNYNVISYEIQAHLETFTESANQLFETINTGLFLTCTARIQDEVLEKFQEEGKGADSENDIGNNEEMNRLEIQSENYRQKAKEGLSSIAKSVKKFTQNCVDMKRLASALEVTRIMGKVESSRISTSNSGLSSLIDDLDILQGAVSDSLKEINGVNCEIQRNIDTLFKRRVA